MLVENSYFPVILGRYVAPSSPRSLALPPLFTDSLSCGLCRSFMERRGVRTDPLDQTSVVFMDTGEVVPTDLVIVRDAHGEVIPIS